MVEMRQAVSEDAEAAIKVVRLSIEQLCTADHRNDSEILATWLANKTPQAFLSWLSNADNFCVVAESDGHLLGVGLLHRSGELRLLYLAPGAQRQGVGSRINSALEEQAKQWGLRKLRLESTASARAFYEAQCYRSAGAAKVSFGVLQSYPYEKELQPNPLS